MKIIIEHLFLLIPLIWEVTTDLYSIKVKKVPDDHRRDLLPRTLLVLLSALIVSLTYQQPYIPAIIYSGILFIVFFDPIMGLALHKDPLYKSPKSDTDQWIAKRWSPRIEIFVRLWLLSVGIACYYQWDLIVG